MKHLLLVLLLSVGTLITQAPPVSAAEEVKPNPVIEALQKHSVTVRTPDGSGSGFVLVRGEHCFVITAAHVVTSLRKEVPQQGEMKPKIEFDDCKVLQKRITEGRITSELSFDAEVVKYSEQEDLALLRIREKKCFTEGMKFYIPKALPPIGTDLLHVGSPLGEIGSQSVIPGFYSGHGRLLEKKVFDYITCSAFPGSSGGAVSLRDGRVVGIVVRGREGGFCLIVPVRRIREWSARAKIESLLFDCKFVCDDKTLTATPIEDR